MATGRDIRLYETGSGGDFQLTGNRFIQAFSFENFPYLAMFGGNPGHPTEEVTEGQERFDYWGNELLWDGNPEIQFNSRTEATLVDVALNSQGRKTIEEAVKSDLSFMTAFAILDINVEIVGLDRVRIDILVQEPENGVQRQFLYLWDGANLIDESVTSAETPTSGEGLQNNLQFDLG